MGYALREGLSYCVVDGRPVFLDLRSDRYFRLPGHLEERFIALSSETEQVDIGELMAQNILREVEAESCAVSPTTTQAVTESALERNRKLRFRTRVFAEVFRSIYSVQRRLRTAPLTSLIDRLIESRADAPQRPVEDPDERAIVHAADEFNVARAYVPIETRCLLDSLALITFLGKRGHHASLVFGVATSPFSAHCWAQVGHLVLNDTVGHVNAFTPIKVI